MKTSLIVALLGLCCTLVSASSHIRGRTAKSHASNLPDVAICAVASDDPALQEKIHLDIRREVHTMALWNAFSVEIPVHFHLMGPSEVISASDEQLDATIEVLNRFYCPAGKSICINFVMASVDRYPEWTLSDPVPESDDDHQMRLQYHKGGANELNVFIVLSTHSLGWSAFPWWRETRSGRSADSVCVDATTLPGGSRTAYNEGKTLVHEVGHWLGLFHTFEGGCSQDRGDWIPDTPPQALENTYCSATKSCFAFPGTDPVHNLMNYPPDDCRDQFTPGQMTRMAAMIRKYRRHASA